MNEVYMVDCPFEGMIQFHTLGGVAEYLKVSQRSINEVLNTDEKIKGCTVITSGCDGV